MATETVTRCRYCCKVLNSAESQAYCNYVCERSHRERRDRVEAVVSGEGHIVEAPYSPANDIVPVGSPAISPRDRGAQVSLSPEEAMAVEVLKGNLAAARALADRLVEQQADKVLPPLWEITTSHPRNLRVAVFFNAESMNEVNVDVAALREAVEDWLRGETQTIAFVGVDRIEVYEIKERFEPEPDATTLRGDRRHPE